MILNKHGHKRTANELAKELVQEHGLGIDATAFWQDVLPLHYTEKITDREDGMVLNAIENQLERVDKLLGSPDSTRNKEDA
jgi:hypothetical protein